MKIHKDCKIELAASKDETRYTITEPYLDMSVPESPVMVATNGVILAFVPVETSEEDKAGYVSAEALKAMRKAKASKMTCNGDWLKITGASSHIRPELGNYPNWRQVIPPNDREVKFAVGLNIRLLWELCQAIGCETARLEFYDDLSAVVVKPTNGGDRFSKPFATPDAYGVIMPIRLA